MLYIRLKISIVFQFFYIDIAHDISNMLSCSPVMIEERPSYAADKLLSPEYI